MLGVPDENLFYRRFLTEVFGPSNPKTFRSLQDLALAAAKANRNAGKISLFGNDKGGESLYKFQRTVEKLYESMLAEGMFGDLPTVFEQFSKMDDVVQLFFFAYPNWKDAESVWEHHIKELHRRLDAYTAG